MAEAKPGILPGGGCTGAKTENPCSTPSGVTAKCPCQRPRSPSGGGVGGRHGLGALRLGALAIPRPTRPCTSSPPGHPSCSRLLCAGSSLQATPEPVSTPHISEPGPDVPVAAAKLGGLPCGGNRLSAPFPVAAEGHWLQVPSFSRGGAERGQGLAGSQARCTRDPEAAQAVLHHLGDQAAGALYLLATAAWQLPRWLALPAWQNRGYMSPWLRPSQAVCPAAAAPGREPIPSPIPGGCGGPLSAAPISLRRRSGSGVRARQALRPEGMHSWDSGTSRASPGEPASQRRLRPSCSRPLPATRAWERLPESRLALSCRRAPNWHRGDSRGLRSER
ncbi:uncharacterized protein LOC129043573 [Pongo pygmaeus]|uniref:uncharacterized protein LOC129043573 n=1 Tax=Pongo pygmaeus TaxID=9600 RepID=UPI0023E1B928|nr:uncharacterized protein LOC129043573 [Pongo pygmaeus]